ncbi:MAG: hypothetical protein JXA10_20125 [Anaerolineae bacterium]|nr:hypothetical protein [Anaerolineae bacterium]
MNLWKWLLSLRFRLEEELRGQGLVEYALILVLVAVVVIAVLVILGPTVAEVYENIIEGL